MKGHQSFVPCGECQECLKKDSWWWFVLAALGGPSVALLLAEHLNDRRREHCLLRKAQVIL